MKATWRLQSSDISGQSAEVWLGGYIELFLGNTCLARRVSSGTLLESDLFLLNKIAMKLEAFRGRKFFIKEVDKEGRKG